MIRIPVIFLFLSLSSICFAGGAKVDGSLARLIIPLDEQISKLIPDQRVHLAGTWSADQMFALKDGLAIASQSREKRFADIHEGTIVNEIVIIPGGVFSHNEKTERVRNMSAMWGSGISGFHTDIFTIPSNATGLEIGIYLKGRLPPHLQIDRAKLEKWQKQVARAKAGGWCSSLLALFK